MTTTVPLGLAEQTEIRAYADFVTSAPSSVRESLGIARLDVGSASVISVREDPSRFFNRAGGFSAEQPVDVDAVARICEFYRENRVPVGSFMIAPSMLPADWPSIAEKFGLTEGNRFIKLGCDVETAVAGAHSSGAVGPGLRVGLVEPHQAREWAAVMMETFEFSAPGMTEIAEACVGKPQWQQYAVWEGTKIVAVGSIFVNGDCADMFGGATLADWRRRGAQSSLLAARVRAAQAAGCRWLVAEAVPEGPGEHNPSLHNMLGVGFERLYERTSWVWREQQA